MSKTRTITLTGRPPVTINEDDWPFLASASDKDWDNEHEFQANRTWYWFVGARQHDDGRAVVYATYSHSSQWAKERGVDCKNGVLLSEGSSAQDVCDAIAEVCGRMEGDRWEELAAECIADMPAEKLA
jgi:hypothetical protein